MGSIPVLMLKIDVPDNWLTDNFGFQFKKIATYKRND